MPLELVIWLPRPVSLPGDLPAPDQWHGPGPSEAQTSALGEGQSESSEESRYWVRQDHEFQVTAGDAADLMSLDEAIAAGLVDPEQVHVIPDDLVEPDEPPLTREELEEESRLEALVAAAASGVWFEVIGDREIGFELVIDAARQLARKHGGAVMEGPDGRVGFDAEGQVTGPE